MAEDNPFTKFAKPGTSAKGSDNPFDKFKRPEEDRAYQSREVATLPEPHRDMFAGMDDKDAAIYHKAYVNHPDSTVHSNGEVYYKGMPVPRSEGNTETVENLTGSWLTNPVGKALSWATGDPEIEKQSQAVMGGVVNTVKAGAEIGGAAIDKVADMNRGIANYFTGGDEPTGGPSETAAAVRNNFPEFNPEGRWEHAGATIGSITTGMALGNKINAVSQIAGIEKAAAAKLAEYIPSWLSKISAALATRLPAQAAGVGIAQPTGSDTLTTGPNAVIPIVAGLDTKTPDEAQNIINDRLNIAADALFTALPIEGVGMGVKTIWNKFISDRILDPLKVLVSPSKRNEVLATEMMERLGHVTGQETAEQKDALRDNLVKLFRDKFKQTMESGKMDIEGVDDQIVKLDPTTMVQREAAGSKSAIDTGLSEGMRQERNKVIQEGGVLTEAASEAPERTLKTVLNQTEAAFGKNDSVKKGKEAAQNIAKSEVQAGKNEAIEQTEKIYGKPGVNAEDNEGILTQMAEKVNRAEELRTKKMNDLYDKISDTVPADMEGITKLVGKAKTDMSVGLQKIWKKNNGTFKYLNNVFKPQLNKEISRLKGLGRDTSALEDIRKNIDGDQLDYIIKQKGQLPGWTPNDAKFAQDAKNFARDDVFQNRQGPLEEVRKISRENPGQTDEIATKSREVLSKTIDEAEKQPEYNKRLKDVLASDEGGRSEELIPRYVNARDRVAELERIEDEVYGGRFKDFMKKEGIKYVPTDNATESFLNLLRDPEGGKTLQKMIDSDDPAIKNALKSTWSKLADSSFFNTITGRKSGGPKISMSNEDRTSLFEYGDKIFKDKPEVLNFVKDLAEVSLDVGKAKTIAAAPAGITTKASGQAAEAGQKVITIQAGRLTHKAAIEGALLQMAVKVINVTPVLKNIKDKAMADPEKMADLLANWKTAEQKKPGSFARDFTRWVTAEGLVNNEGATNRFEDDVRNKLGNTKRQTDDLLNQKKGVIDDLEGFGSGVLETGVKGFEAIAEQTRKALGR